ncbi:MAG: phosphotransferase [Zymomonas mobilis]|uniref:Ser/Thr protein kinase RdoA (MazF antagonist) n=1 Tax=Zymomonas mobilis TaxID=542 RepID=A0A542W2S1_ZYMMB|nr:phosphotransferase [Zymomonas mobilis]TQL17884.1 Ser/Thr protein kinase RdoA (MazF antagonist) [Zymomonas mobilis]
MTEAADKAVHQFGVSGYQSKRDWPYLTMPEINTVLASYSGQGKAINILSHSRRPYSAAALFETDNHQKRFIKRHHCRIRNKSELIKEHRFAFHLDKKAFPISTPLIADNQESLIEKDPWLYEIHPAAKGMDIYQDVMSWEPFFCCEHAYEAGKMLAHFHLAAEGFDEAPRHHALLVSAGDTLLHNDFIAALSDWITAQPELSKQLETKNWQKDITENILPFHQKLRLLIPAIIPLWGHGDWHSSNLIWTGKEKNAKVSCVLDLGMADYTSAMFDLATAVERNVVEWLAMDSRKDIVLYDQLLALLRGYHDVRPLSQTDKQLLSAFLPLQHIEYALSEITYFGTLLQDTASAEVAYHDYLLGHCRWFSGEEGQRLLQSIIEFKA